MSKKYDKLNRRDFLKLGATGTLGLSLFGSLWPKELFAQTTTPGKFPVLIQLELFGGCDPINFSAFTGDAQYDALRKRRPSNTKIEPDQVVSIDSSGISPVGLHPLLGTPLKNEGHLDSLRLMLNFTNVPNDHSRSHRDQQRYMAFGTEPNINLKAGTLARLYDSGVELIGFGGGRENYTCETCEAPPLSINSLESFNLEGVNFRSQYGGSANADMVSKVLEDLASANPNRETSPLEVKYRSTMRDMFVQLGDVREILKSDTPEAANYNRDSIPYGYLGKFNSFGTQLRNIATIINYKMAQGETKPMIFNIAVGGFDTHGNWMTGNNSNMYQLGEQLAVFIKDLKAIEAWDQVILYTMTEFGRRIHDNGSGTDHGDGLTAMLMGGKVKGGIFGDPLTVKQIDTLDNWPERYDFRAVLAQILDQHMGINPQAAAYPGPIYDSIQGKNTNFELFA